MREMIFKVFDNKNRKIRLTKKQWSHIRQHHAEVENPEEIKETIQMPDSIILDERENVENFFKFFKHKKQKSKYLKVVVKYLYEEGFIITSYYTRTIR